MARKAKIEQKPPFGQLILRELNKSNLTQKWLSAQIGVSAQHISNIISGKDNPSIRTLSEIANKLNIKKGDILNVFIDQR
jgi:transcriptional regulator with XRE-family HTH domain